MENKTGTFIVIEGTDGSGKGTQFKLLSDHLTSLGYDVATFDFPQYDQPSSYFVKQYLNGNYGGTDAVGPYTSSLFYALDRYEAAPKIRKALQDGKIVLCNRFVGSSMAHQGTKLANPHERRGFFIWLDNLEFEVLRLPRPTISFVLRVPADIAQSLVDKKEERTYTDKKRDIHEADLDHLKRSVEVYDDLTQLFPKDFQRIDCVRNGQLLDIASIQKLLWEKVVVALPPAPKIESTPAPAASPATPSAMATLPVQTPQAKVPEDRKLIINNVSVLFRQVLSSVLRKPYDEKLLPYQQKDGRGNYQYYTPKELDADVASQYKTHMDQLFDNYAKLVEDLSKYLLETASSQSDKQKEKALWQAISLLQPLLPLAVKASITAAFDTAGAIKETALLLAQQSLPEAQAVGQKLLQEIDPKSQSIEKPKKTKRADDAPNLQELASTYLPDTYATDAPLVRLASVWPRNELDIVPEMLYVYGNVALNDLRQGIASWPYERKSDVFATYLQQWSPENPGVDTALAGIHYSFELLCDYATFRYVQCLPLVQDTELQTPNPRYGYDTPELVEAAGLGDAFDDCFDASLKLYSLLQSSGNQAEAPYAMLQGHKVRCKFSCNAQQLLQITNTLRQTEPQSGHYKLAVDVQDKLAETHPMIAAAMTKQP